MRKCFMRLICSCLQILLVFGDVRKVQEILIAIKMRRRYSLHFTDVAEADRDKVHGFQNLMAL